ncbi:hypothetical protein [Natronorubrum sp. FCH18a]|uniref:hypothetical protein n=1 Tax=Natronorubrum sp. FCH18a TaxID=3447018 RepID=UPI003F50DA78
MSLGDGRIPEKEAEQEAEEELRLNIGNLPHLGTSSDENGEYRFPILISLPRVIFNQTEEGVEAVDVRFLSEAEIGEIRVDAQTGDIIDRTDVDEINSQIRDRRREIERAVQKALIKSSAKKFSLLPYPTHRYTPVQDMLSEVILSGEIPEKRFQELNHDNREKYETHLSILMEVNLLQKRDGYIAADDELIQLQADHDRPSETLNEAMAHLLEEKVDDIEMLENILGPYLRIAGYYYRRAIESEDLPKVSKKDIRRQMEKEYSGEQSRIKQLQTARYLLQLEQVGLLESTTEYGSRMWTGEEDVKSDVLDQEKQLSPIAEIIAT